MFYSQFILAKKGPLGTIWIAAHLERKLRKTQVADTNIPLSVDSILFPDVPIALRLSSHLLLGVVRIYSRKVNYLFDDCSEALLKIKQAFRSTAVDLAPEESTAPYHSITLPETFDLDDFELPDNDILQGNYVDHHVSTKEQITLQDTMDGVVYTTSQFGLDERFGDGDSSHVGLDLEQDMLLDKVTAPCPEEIPEVDPHVTDASPARLVGSFVPLPLYGTNNKIEGQHVNLEVTDYAQGPSTPGLVNEPNLSSVQEGLACDDHLDPEDPHCTGSLGVESTENTSMKLDLHRADDATDLLLASHADCDTVERTALDNKENNHDSWDLRDKEDMKGNLPAEVAVEGLQEKGVVGDVGDANEFAHCKGSSVAHNGEHGEFVGVGCHEVDNMDIGIETEGSESREKADIPNSISSLEACDAVVPVSLLEVFHEPENPKTKNHLDDGHSGLSFGSVLQPCSSFPGVQSYHEIDDTMRPHDIPLEDVPCTLGKDEAPYPPQTCSNIQGEVCLITSSVRGEESQMIEPTISTDALADGQCHNVGTVENQFDKLDGPTTFELPAPEQLLSLPQMPLDKLEGLLLESLSNVEVLERSDGASTGAKISGNKRTYTDSMVDMQCLNSVDTFGMSKLKRTINSIPDDDDLLSSILAGRRSSVLKIKPSPVAPEVTSTKRVKSTSRSTAMKRKVLVDDSMVLLGDTIRQQLINTEDIRRLRKKAPCTRTEILIIERQFLEEDIFHEAVLTGMSTELLRLHGQKFDVSGIEITVNDGNIVPSEIEVNKESLHGPSFAENSVLQGDIEPMTSGVIIEGQEIEHSTQAKTKQDEEHVLHTEDNDMRGLSVTGTSEHEISCERTDGKVDEVFRSPVPELFHNEPISGNVTDAPFGSITEETLKHTICADASLPMDTLGMPCDDVGNGLLNNISFPGGGISGEGLDAIEALDCKIDNVAADAADLGPEDETLVPESKVNKSSEITSDVQAIVNSHTDDGNTLLVDMSAETARLASDTSVNIAEDIGSDKLGYINEEGRLAATSGYDDNDKKSVYLSGEDNQIDITNGAGPDRDMDKEYLNDNLDGHELHQHSSLNAENPLNNNVEGQCGDFQDVTFANDTEFLNVDDDEMAEDEGFAAGAEDTWFLDNSGWSSRTRAVANFLQNLFDKEAAYGVKVLSMDNLLTGKTRKEASRMFFETLVLKTKDYVQVEQVKPFNDISIKARAKLLKSDF